MSGTDAVGVATRVVQFTDVVPVATPAANPRVKQCQLGVCTLRWIELQTPPGSRGQMGLYVASSLQQVLPYREDVAPIWMYLDGVTRRYDTVDFPDSGDFQVVAYNTGAYPHQWWARFGVDDTSVQTGDNSLGSANSIQLLSS